MDTVSASSQQPTPASRPINSQIEMLDQMNNLLKRLKQQYAADE
jgi:hypothetical protein